MAWFLIADPSTGKVVRRAREPQKIDEPYCALAVDKEIWKSYRAGDLVLANELDSPSLSMWVDAQLRHERRDKQKKAAERYMRRVSREG